MVTSSKALASLKASTMGGSGAIIANVLATKGGVSNTTAANAAAVNTRKRAALGDLSNIQVQAVKRFLFFWKTRRTWGEGAMSISPPSEEPREK